MKKFWIYLAPLFLFACKNKKSNNGILYPSNIASQYFSIDPDKDIVIRTSHNAIFQFNKGTFKSQGPVSIEIKEIYTPYEILLSGITTTSDGRPLRSAGMVYFNATADGKKIEPSQPIKTLIPSKEPNSQMQVFKGEMQEDSTVNWIEPQRLDTTKPKSYEHRYSYGRTLFQNNCASCHSVFTNRTGPALRDFQYRGPWKNVKNILAWVRNPPAFMANDKYTQGLKNQYGVMMLAFPSLTENDIADLLTYINNVKAEDPSPMPVASTDTSKDCGVDTVYVFMRNNYDEYDTVSPPDILPITTINPEQDTTVYPNYPYDEVYSDIYQEGYAFEIEANGWYNIDEFLKENSGDVVNVELIADLKMTEDAFMNVHVFIPTERVMQSTVDKKGNQYYFDVIDGAIPLPLRHRAVIFAFGSSKDKILYGVSEFTIERKQLVPVEIKETTKEGLKNLLHSKNLNGIEIDAMEKKMEIRKIPCNDTPVVTLSDIIVNTPN